MNVLQGKCVINMFVKGTHILTLISCNIDTLRGRGVGAEPKCRANSHELVNCHLTLTFNAMAVRSGQGVSVPSVDCRLMKFSMQAAMSQTIKLQRGALGLTQRICIFLVRSSLKHLVTCWAGQQQLYGPLAGGIHLKTCNKTLCQT